MQFDDVAPEWSDSLYIYICQHRQYHFTLTFSAHHAHLMYVQLILKIHSCATALAVHLFFFSRPLQGDGAQGVQSLHGGLATGCSG